MLKYTARARRSPSTASIEVLMDAFISNPIDCTALLSGLPKKASSELNFTSPDEDQRTCECCTGFKITTLAQFQVRF